MIYLILFWEFFKIGLFAIGGGAATIPFLADLTYRFNWYTMADLTNMVAIAESTPGPIGVNMATYAGFHAGGVLGGFIATLGLVTPSVIIIILIARFLSNFSENKTVKAVFYGVRPAVTALIAASVIGLFQVSLFTETGIAVKPLLLAVIFFCLMQVKQLKKLHPGIWLLGAALIGMIFKF